MSRAIGLDSVMLFSFLEYVYYEKRRVAMVLEYNGLDVMEVRFLRPLLPCRSRCTAATIFATLFFLSLSQQ